MISPPYSYKNGENMTLDFNKEARHLRASGVTIKMIQNELKQREILENELREFGIASRQYKNEETNILSKYNDNQLKRLMEQIDVQESYYEKNIVPFKSEEKGAKKMINSVLGDITGLLSANIYDQIKGRLAACETREDYESAYKWLANQFVLTNESAKKFEEQVIEKYGEAEIGAIIYGSEEAYEREVSYENRLQNANTATERQTILFEKLMSETLREEDEMPILWSEDEPEIEELQA